MGRRIVARSLAVSRRRLAEDLVTAAWVNHDILHTAPADAAVVPLWRWSLGTLRAANRLAKFLGAQPQPWVNRRGDALRPSPRPLHVVKGGRA